MPTEVATAPLPVVEAERSAPPSVSPAKSRDVAATPSKKQKTSATTVAITATSPSAGAATSSAPLSVSSGADKAGDSPSPSKRGEQLPKIIVKKEPTSPEPPSRHRPPKLHLNNDPDASGPSVPRTAGGNLSTMRDVGMACLSPGFATQDPTMREQLQRSISVRDQQRSIIEARLQRHAKPGGKDTNEPGSARGAPPHSGKRRPPNSLTIVPPPHRAFANERVVQSAPLHQSFTGRHHHSSMINPPLQHTPNQPNVNRLPPISDVFASDRLDSGARTSRPVDPPQSGRHYYSSSRPSQPSPNNLSYPPKTREHRSAEEALQMLSGGREDLLPRIIHYGGHQPPTPPSPPQAGAQNTPSKHASEYHTTQTAGRRRTRAEYERESDYCGPGSRDSPETKRAKKEEFLALCARAWELFHS